VRTFDPGCGQKPLDYRARNKNKRASSVTGAAFLGLKLERRSVYNAGPPRLEPLMLINAIAP
jgi:hypothetical protein